MRGTKQSHGGICAIYVIAIASSRNDIFLGFIPYYTNRFALNILQIW